jgi:hypothetical protein
LREEAPDAKEFAGLKQSGLKRLADADKHVNSLESRFGLAYRCGGCLPDAMISAIAENMKAISTLTSACSPT